MLCPQSSRVDDVFGGNRALLRHHLPETVLALELQDAIVLDDFSTVQSCGLGVGIHRAGCVDITLAIGPQATNNIGRVDDRTSLLDLAWCHQVTVFDSNG